MLKVSPILSQSSSASAFSSFKLNWCFLAILEIRWCGRLLYSVDEKKCSKVAPLPQTSQTWDNCFYRQKLIRTGLINPKVRGQELTHFHAFQMTDPTQKFRPKTLIGNRSIGLKNWFVRRQFPIQRWWKKEFYERSRCFILCFFEVDLEFFMPFCLWRKQSDPLRRLLSKVAWQKRFHSESFNKWSGILI